MITVLKIGLISAIALQSCSTPRITETEKATVTDQADAVSRTMDAWASYKITHKQMDYLLREEAKWERGIITQDQYEAEERKIIQ